MKRSQPLLVLLSQLAYAKLHAPRTQAPDEHDADALALVQAVPHVPQFALVLSAVSHPLATPLSQLPKPGLQAWIVHCPCVQLGVAWEVKQTWPMPPQLFTSVDVLMQWPMPSQTPP